MFEKNKNKKTVLVTGSFNLIHPGHLRLLKFAHDIGGHLIVAVYSDELAADSAYLAENFRLEAIQSIGFIDESFILFEPVDELINKLKPDIVVKGKEHERKFNIELEPLKKYGGDLVFSSGDSTFSSIDLIRNEFRDYDAKGISIPNEYLQRHDICIAKLINAVKSFSRLKICVVGDLIIDEYITCDALGMSQEDPTVVVTPVDSVSFIGGAGIVAAHAAGLGAKVDFLSVAGCDDEMGLALSALQDARVSAHIFSDISRPTTLKQRFRCKGKTLLRVTKLHQGAISKGLQDNIFQKFSELFDELDLLIFSDFNYGCLPQELVDKLISAAKTKKITLVADSQSSSQIGDIGRFKGMDLITPTEREARISMRNNEDGLVVLAEKLREQTLAKNILLKLGAEGFLIYASQQESKPWITDRIKALNSSPKDVSGAGDSLLSIGSMAMACGCSIVEASILGAIAAAVQVSRVGNTPLQSSEIIQLLEAHN
jgi:rfaE bifunctional protein kinase chain/domain